MFWQRCRLNAALGSSLVLVGMFGLGATVVTAQEAAGPDSEAAVLPAVPEWTQGLQTLQIDDELFNEGLAYYLIRDQHAQVAIEINGPLTRLIATSSRAGGVLIGPFDADEVGADESPLVAGSIRIPAASLTTGTGQDRTLHSGMALDVANHTDIAFVFESAKTLGRKPGTLADSTLFDLELQGSLIFKGKSVPLTVEAELTLMLSNETTFGSGFVGDVARLTGEFEVTVEQLGLVPRVAAFLGETAQVRFFLMFSTPDPERPIIPPSTPAAVSLQTRYRVSLRDRADAATAFAAGEQLLKAAWDDPGALVAFATSAAADTGLSRRFLGQAKRAAERVLVLGGDSPDPMALNVLARIAGTAGEVQQAIDLQTKAIELATHGRAARAKPIMQRDLALYEYMLAERKASEER